MTERRTHNHFIGHFSGFFLPGYSLIQQKAFRKVLRNPRGYYFRYILRSVFSFQCFKAMIVSISRAATSHRTSVLWHLKVLRLWFSLSLSCIIYLMCCAVHQNASDKWREWKRSNVRRGMWSLLNTAQRVLNLYYYYHSISSSWSVYYCEY